MTQIILTFAQRRKAPLSCVWFRTGNPAQPLACRWVTVPKSSAEADSASTDAPLTHKRCA